MQDLTSSSAGVQSLPSHQNIVGLIPHNVQLEVTLKKVVKSYLVKKMSVRSPIQSGQLTPHHKMAVV